MNNDDFRKILDSMEETGVYVIREEDYRILYCNRRVREVTPDAKEGMVCRDLWPGCCGNCPLLTIGDKKTSRTVNYNSPFGHVVDLVATRIMWEDRIPAFVITLTPHREESSVRSQEVIRSLGEQNFDIYLIDLDADLVDPVRVDGQMQENSRGFLVGWDRQLRLEIQEQVHWEYQEEFQRRFSLEGLKKARAAGNGQVEMICQWSRSGEIYSYISIQASFGGGEGRRQYVTLALQDVEDRVRQEIASSQRDMQMAAILKCRYSEMTTVHLYSGLCENIDLNSAAGPEDFQPVDYVQLVSERLEEIVPEDAVQVLQALSLEHLQQTALETEDYLEEVCQYRLKGQPVRWMEQHIIYSRQFGEVIVNIMGRDITREKSQEADRVEQDREKADIIRSMSGLFFATYYVDLDQDLFQRVIQLRDGGKLLGTRSGYTQGLQTYTDKYIHPEDQEEYLEMMSISNLRENLGKDRPYLVMEYRMVPGNPEAGPEECGWIRSTAVPVRTDEKGHPVKVLCASQDVTRSKQKEAREQRALREACQTASHASASKSEFLSRMSHDIRTPMNGIIGMAGIAASHVREPERVLDCLKKITVSGRHLLTLVNEVLDMSQIESGKIDLAEEEFSIPELVQSLVTIVGPSAQEKGHRLRIHPMELEHSRVVGDSSHLRQVFVNILGNGVKYTPAGGLLEIEVREKESREHGLGCYDFVFRDNGIGMDEEFVARIFEPFSRAEDSRISTIEGTGLGMTIALNIVRMMGGSIAVKSSPGAGSQFTVTLFLKLVTSSDGTEEPGREVSGEEDRREWRFEGHRILLVEDNEINREIAVEVIGETGALVECAENGKQGVEMFAGKEPGYYSLIIMDIQMPVMDGYKATRAIRSLPREDGRQIPIIAMSANAFAEDISASREAGMNEHITKPLDVDRLMGCMHYWMNGGEGCT